jgi:hypothetical protein
MDDEATGKGKERERGGGGIMERAAKERGRQSRAELVREQGE